MNNVKTIREKLGLTQKSFGDGIGCTQGNVGHYEQDRQVIPPDAAGRLIDFAATLGHVVTYDDIYSKAEPLPVITAAPPTQPTPNTKETERLMGQAFNEGLIKDQRVAPVERREVNRIKDARLAAFEAKEAEQGA